MTSYVKFVSWNVKGLNSPSKRFSLLDELKSKHIHVALLQETHITKGKKIVLKNKFFSNCYHCFSPISKARGVSILISKELEWTYIDSFSDPGGRYLVLKGKISEVLVTIINFYTPNTNQITFIEDMLHNCLNFAEGIILMGGDLNAALNPILDTSRGASHFSGRYLDRLNNALKSCEFVDIWRSLHGAEKDYTFYSNVHKSYSRIDYFFIKNSQLSIVHSAEIGSSVLSDHSPLYVQLEIDSVIGRPWTWQLNNSLLQDCTFQKEIEEEIVFFLEVHKNTTVSPIIKWETLKCYIRGIIIAYAARKKKENDINITKLIKQIQEMEQVHKTTLSSSLLAELHVLRSKLSSLLNNKQKARYLKTKANFYEWGNKTGPSLARLSIKQNKRVKKRGIDLGGGIISNKNKDIVDAFEKFYSRLYNIDSCKDKTLEDDSDIKDSFFSSLGHKKLSPEEANMLDQPLSVDEWNFALKSSKANKAPGPDGYSLSFYRTFSELLMRPFLEAYNGIGRDSPFPTDSLRAIISVILKPDKDSTQCKNYRPISLLNIDLKIFTKILATRLQRYLSCLIHPDQTGFVPKRNIRDNTLKVLNIIQYAQVNEKELMLLSIDAEKAFDRVNWRYMSEALRYYGLGNRIMEWITALYQSPMATVKVDGRFSSYFHTSNGTRQGCPLSAILFVLSLEPFLSCIRNNENIMGIEIGNSHYKLSAYADDILFYITNPQISLPNLMRSFEEYQNLSNFKVNWSKSIALDVSLKGNQQAILKQSFSFDWADLSFDYLGLKVAKSIPQLYEFNYMELLKQINTDFVRWTKRNFSWFGRVALLKMNILPRILYIMQCMPIPLPKKYLSQIKNTFVTFIWGKKKLHRLNQRLLFLPKKSGGLGIPDIFKYYKAIHYARVLDWCLNSASMKRDWIQIEQSMSEIDLQVLPWILNGPIQQKIHNPYVVNTLKVIQGRPNLITLGETTLMSPVLGDLNFTLGHLDPFFQNLKDKGTFRLWHFWKWFNSTSTSIFAIASQLFPGITWLQTMQLHSRVRQMVGDGNIKLDLSEFERLCKKEQPIDHSLSRIYHLLQGHSATSEISKPDYIVKWERDLGYSFSPEQISRILYFTHNFSTACSFQENAYKILSRWYLVPTKLHKIFPTSSPKCWRCMNDEGSMFHIFWSCNKLRSFWDGVREIVNLITGYDLGISPENYIFHLAPIPLKLYKKLIIPFLLNTAKICISCCWKQTSPPSIGLWFQKMSEVMSMEETLAYTYQSIPKFREIWQSWISFINSSHYTNYI